MIFASFAAAFSVSAHIEGKRIDPRRRELAGHTVPRLAVAVSLMQQQYTRPRFARSKVAGLQLRAVGSFDVDILCDDAFRGRTKPSSLR